MGGRGDPHRRRHRLLIRGEKLVGVALIIVGLLVAPMGVSIFK